MKIFTWYGPLLKAISAAMAAFGLVAIFHQKHYYFSINASWYSIWTWFSLGVFYTHVFEYFYHRFALHRGLPGLKKMKKGHRQHHRIFHPLNYKTKNPADLGEVTTRWPVFPILLFIHYFITLAVWPKNYLGFVSIFFFGVLLRFLAYDVTHYFSHLDDNFFDRLVAKIPLLRRLRAYQDRHHCYTTISVKELTSASCRTTFLIGSAKPFSGQNFNQNKSAPRRFYLFRKWSWASKMPRVIADPKIKTTDT